MKVTDQPETESRGDDKDTADMVSTKGKVGSSSSNGSSRRRRSRGPSRRSSLTHHAKHYVEHHYHDHYHDPMESEGFPAEPEEDDGAKKRRGHRGGVAVPFPEKLHYMLSRMDDECTTEIVAWQPHGRCFIVRKPGDFVEKIMPRYFRQSKLTSFQRQLNLYGFSRLTAGPDRGAYYHELFIRGRMDLCKRMVRTRVKGNGSKAASSPATEPNFYIMEPCKETDAPHRVRDIQDDFTEEEASGRPFDLPLVRGDLDTEDENGVGSNSMVILDDEPPDVMTTPGVVSSSFFASVTPPHRIGRSGSVSSATSSIENRPSIPIVSPLEARKLVSPPRSPKDLLSLSIPPVLPSMEDDDSFLRQMEDIHSGDQVYFEGLPFHYLETKDVEENLSPPPTMRWVAL